MRLVPVLHPVRQRQPMWDIRQKAGLLQAFGVFIDTIVICSCTAMIIMLLAPADMLQGLEGMTLLQTAMQYHLGSFGTIFIAATLWLFSFSTFIGILFMQDPMWHISLETTGCLRHPIKYWHW